MEPVPPHVRAAEAVQAAIYDRMTPAQRYAVARRMVGDMRVLMDAGLLAEQPHLSAAERRREIARRILTATT